MDNTPYRGRFAPTPSGPLHLGSLLTAVASYLQARSRRGLWLLRMDDLDVARNAPGAAARILRQLETHGLHWDESPRLQSSHITEYLEALERLRGLGLIYRCNCTRKRLGALAAPDAEPIYDGHCRVHPPRGGACALRVIALGTVAFVDGWQGAQQVDLAINAGDFVVRRADDVVAYQLACAIDEAAQNVTEVVRGADLLDSSFRQIYLQQKLGLPSAAYKHLPVLLDARGKKLSKQNYAHAIEANSAPDNLVQCLRLLDQNPPDELAQQMPTEILAWACAHWSEKNVPRTPTLQVE